MNNKELYNSITDLHKQLLDTVNTSQLPLPLKHIIIENIYLTVSQALNKTIDEENP